MVLHKHDSVLLLPGELIQIFLILLFFRTSNLLLSEALIRCHHRVGHEDHLEAKVFYSSATQPCKAIHRSSDLIIALHPIIVNVACLMALAWLHQLDDIGDRHEGASENGTISRLGLIHRVTAKNHIDGARHGAGWDITGQLLQAELLPVKIDRVG